MMKRFLKSDKVSYWLLDFKKWEEFSQDLYNVSHSFYIYYNSLYNSNIYLVKNSFNEYSRLYIF